jgi:hypothetical protein
MVGGIRATLCALSMSGAIAVASLVSAQQRGADADDLEAGIGQVRSGDFFGAALTLNDVVKQLSARAEDKQRLARAYAYLAAAYVGIGQPERAQAAARQALEADPQLEPGGDEFPQEALELFDRARLPASRDPEGTGRAAEAAGRFQEAFLEYVSAFRALPDPAPEGADRRLRESILRLAQELDAKPMVPSEARQHVDRAQQLLEAHAVLGSPDDPRGLTAAAAELEAAVRAAPWWGDPLFKLAAVQQKLGQVDDALVNLSLYRVADPHGYDVAVAQATRKQEPPPGPTAQRREEPPVPAVVYVYWPPQTKAGLRGPDVECDGQRMAALKKSHFVALKVVPGDHSISIGGGAVTGTFEPGGEYYVRGSIGGFPAHFNTRFVSKAEAEQEMRGRVTINDPRHTFATECGGPAPLRKDPGRGW